MTALTVPVSDWPSSATDTVHRVIAWAANPSGVPPHGSLRAPSSLLQNMTTVGPLQKLARATAARMGAGQPALGDESALGPGALFLAAAIGGRLQPELSARLAALVAPPALGRTSSTGWADAIARHAVVAPALAASVPTGPGSGPNRTEPLARPALAESLRESLLRASPLTEVLFRPADGQQARAVEVALGLRARPHGTGVLATALSGWHTDTKVLTWRAQLLFIMATAHPTEVIEVYAAARLCHGAEWDRRITDAAAALAVAATVEPNARSVATVQYWAPLFVRQVRERLDRRSMLRGYEAARSLVQHYGLETIGAP
jgi:hypothetical protein